MTPEERQEIQELYRQGWSIRAIARRLGRNRKTIRRALRLPRPPRRASKIEPFGEIIRERLQAGRERAKAEGKILHRPRKELPVNEIERLYCEVGLSATAIGKLVRVSTATVLSRLRKVGVEIR